PSVSETQVEVRGLTSGVILAAPANAAPGSAVTLTAVVTAAQGIPTGRIVFHDGNTNVGIAPLDGSGTAILRIDSLALGNHVLTATYAGDDKFAASASIAVNLNIANHDFTLSANPPSTTIVAGQPAQFTVTVTPSGGFANGVALSCSPV